MRWVYEPFSAAGIRFIPTFDRGLVLNPGQDLTFFYQVWESRQLQNSSGDLHVQYAYGRMGMRDTKIVEQDVPYNQFDENGALINGKKISTAELLPGNYRMSVIVSDTASHQRAVGSFQFSIADTNATPPGWDVLDPQAYNEFTKGQWDYLRSLCYTYQGKDDQALIALQRAFKKNPDEATRDKLADLLFSQKAYDQVAALYAWGGITKDTDDLTVLQMAESLERTGKVSKSIQLLESAVTLRQSGPLYLALGRYYQVVGNHEKASEMEQKGKQITRSTPQS